MICWCKAGLDEGISRYLLITISIILIVKSFSLFRKQRYPILLTFFYSIFILFYFILSYFNPMYENLSEKHLNEIDFHNKIQDFPDIEKSNFVFKRINLIIATGNKSKSESLSLFNDLILTYRINYLEKDNDPLWALINELYNMTKVDAIKWIPSLTIDDTKILWNIYLLLSAFYLFAFLSSIKLTTGSVQKICVTILVNSSLLAIIGIYQKVNYDFNFQTKEILGIWDAPEPRYYFSTFTYKNHWSAFAIVSSLIGSTLLIKHFHIFGASFYRSKEFLVIVLLLSPVLFSVLFSGSRSGTLFLFISLFFTLLYYTRFILLPKLRCYLLISIFLIGFISLFFIDKNNVSKEMLINTKSQFQKFTKGEFPLRYYLWKDAVRVGANSPIFGWGYYSYSSINPLFQSSHVKKERSIGLSNAHTPYIPLIAHAHNDWLEWWCEWGTLGLVLFGIPLLVLLFARLLNNKDPVRTIFLFSVIIILAYSLVDFPTRTPACLILTAICSGVGISRPTKE